jgi:hypothetical protein
MNAIGAYGIVRAQEAGRKQRESYPADEPQPEGGAKGPGLRARVRKLFGAKRVTREPGFAASSSWLEEFVRRLGAHPVQPSYR